MSRLARVAFLLLAMLALLAAVVWLASTPSRPLQQPVARPQESEPTAGIEMPGLLATVVALPAALPGTVEVPTNTTALPATAGPSPSAIDLPTDTAADPLLDPADPEYNDAPAEVVITGTAEIRRAHLTFELFVANGGPGTVTRLDLFVAVPQNRDNQTISDLEFSAPYTLLADQYGQPVARFTFTDLAPGKQVRVAWEGDIEVWAIDYQLDPNRVGSLDDIPADIVELYTADESKYGLTDPTIRAAARIAGGGATNPYWIARNVHDFVVRRLRYQNDGQWEDAPTIYRQGQGSCSEYSFLFVALARANGLPARYVAGTRQRREGPYVDVLFHRWTEVYLPPYGWVPVDSLHDDRAGGPLTTYFGAVSDERFVTTVSGGDSEYLGWNYHYGYRYEYSGTEPNLTRRRRFTWQP